ncbi:MAG: hypothetical protein ACYC4L_14895 [Chloroflexota bacterium]
MNAEPSLRYKRRNGWQHAVAEVGTIIILVVATMSTASLGISPTLQSAFAQVALALHP